MGVELVVKLGHVVAERQINNAKHCTHFKAARAEDSNPELENEEYASDSEDDKEEEGQY